jgi:chitosanase
MKIPNKNALIAGSCAVAVLVIGFAIVSTRAAGSFLSIEGESGTLAGGAAQGNDSQASGGKFVQFAAPVVTPPAGTVDLYDSKKKEIAMMLVSSAENSSLDWKQQYAYIEYNVEGNAAENRGYTGGIIGFTSRTHDMLEMVRYYQQIAPGNVLAKYITALQNVDGTSSQAGLGTNFERDWATAANDPKFREAQDRERDRVYFNVAVNMAKADKVRTLGQFAYYDAAVMHGPDDWGGGLVNIRAAALQKAKTPAQGGDEKTWLNAFLDAREAEMKREEGHADTTRVSTGQRKFLNEGNYDLNLPLSWSVYGDPFNLTQAMLDKYMSTGAF